ncbi:hypothetical protein IPC239_31025 [Pseudomonas aeruginosa]|nr:hypothetical protein IPC239_31025 [Pseudomonas aeruginosa]
MNRFFFVTLDTAIAATYRHLYRHLLTTQVIQRDGIACCDFVLAEHSGQIYPPGNTLFSVAIAQLHVEAFALLLVEKIRRRAEIYDHTLTGIHRCRIICGRFCR